MISKAMFFLMLELPFSVQGGSGALGPVGKEGGIAVMLPPFQVAQMGDELDLHNRDYFGKHPQVRELLRNVEDYHLQPGIDKMNAGDLEGAFGEFAFILRYYPNHPRVLAMMGDVTLALHKPEVGDEYFRKAIILYPESIGASGYRNYGKFLYKAGRIQESLDALKRSQAMDGGFSETHYYLGLVYFEARNYPLANHHAQKAYGRGFPLPELRNKLTKAGAWQPDPPPPPRAATPTSKHQSPKRALREPATKK